MGIRHEIKFTMKNSSGGFLFKLESVKFFIRVYIMKNKVFVQIVNRYLSSQAFVNARQKANMKTDTFDFSLKSTPY